MFFFIGLGNPGIKYKNTRHNFAWILFDFLASEENIDWEYDKFLNAKIFFLSFSGKDFLFVKPEYYMNRSGFVISKLKKKYPEFSYTKLILVHDELDIPFLKIVCSFGKSDAGHKGVQSIFYELGTKDILRVRLGLHQVIYEKIIKPDVLSRFSEKEILTIREKIYPNFKKIISQCVREQERREITK